MADLETAHATLDHAGITGAGTPQALDTTDSPQFAGVNVGHASDTTITRVSAGNLAVEGNALYRAGGTDVAVTDGGTGASSASAGFNALSPMTTSGDMIYGGASGTGTRLPKGTDGEILTLVSGLPSWEANSGVADILDLPTAETDDTLVLAPDGAGGVEFRAEAGAGGSGALVFLEAHTASGSASLDFTSFISSTYETYKIEGVALVMATDNVDLRLQVGTGGGPTYDTGANYQWGRQGYICSSGGTNNDQGNSGAGCRLFGGMDNGLTAVAFGSFSLTAINLQSTTYDKIFYGTSWFLDNSTNGIFSTWGGIWLTAGTAVTALRFIPSSGNIASGTIRIYGVTKV